jgi:hypothetical protein
MPVFVKLDTMPGNIIDLGTNLTYLKLYGTFDYIYSEDLLVAVSPVPYLWETRNSSVHLPLGLNATSVSLMKNNPVLTRTKSF